MSEDIYTDYEEELEDDEVSGAEAGFMMGYNQAGGQSDGISNKRKT